MRRFCFFVAILALPVLATVEKIHTIPVDLRTPASDFRLVWEDETTPRVQVPVKLGGFPVPNVELTGWTGMLYYAESDTANEGMMITGTLTNSTFAFAVNNTQVATTGVYFAQLLFQDETRVQEWARGTLTIRGAGAADATWSATVLRACRISLTGMWQRRRWWMPPRTT